MLQLTILMTISTLLLSLLQTSVATAEAGKTQYTLTLEPTFAHYNFKSYKNTIGTFAMPDLTADGNLHGMSAAYVRQGKERTYLRIAGQAMGGNVSGYNQTTRKLETKAILTWAGEVNLGYTFVGDRSNLAFTPYLGAGYRTTDYYPQFGISTPYTALGSRLDWLISPVWRTGIDLAGRLPIPGVKSSVPMKMGFEVTIPVAYRLTKSFSLTAAINTERLYYSTMRTESTGLRLGMQYHF